MPHSLRSVVVLLLLAVGEWLSELPLLPVRGLLLELEYRELLQLKASTDLKARRHLVGCLFHKLVVMRPPRFF